MKLFAVLFVTLLIVTSTSGSCTLSKAGRCVKDFGRNSHRAMGNRKALCQAAQEFGACIRSLGECEGSAKHIVDKVIKKIINSGCSLGNESNFPKASMMSVFLPALVLGTFMQTHGSA
ncbi:uncharacterized protein LOC118765732 isoform X2 [Octopus sinensis]|uniref:Uncharacterized protein LOC118765732 isoform X2 n=1 Tax=Octopus sinensis TaxID=2607531 RepID=A0A7E6F889_9MOLL|nr:uncharacterized protein LOC118765732 isoform X2 [Octopus sinensis]